MQLSVLDLATVCEGGTVRDALDNSVRLAQHAEALGFLRFWLAEHHSLPTVASAATAVVIGHVAAATSRIRVGAGGIMLPNHPPLVVAEQFGTLESLFPGRIDLGLGRAPGSDSAAQRALRRPRDAAAGFINDVQELQYWFARPQPDQPVYAMPGAGLDVPLWILGSSTFGADAAAALGLPYAFASHFAPAQLELALSRYRQSFRPSAQQPRPHIMLAVNVIAAGTDDEANYLYTSLQQTFLRLRSGRPGPFPPPRALTLTAADQAFIDHTLACSLVGSPDTVRRGLRAFCERHQPDEVIVTVPIFDIASRLRSLELTAEAANPPWSAASR